MHGVCTTVVYDIFSNNLKSQGLLISPYDRCIANITIKYKQYTIAWYVDYNKVSHVDEEIKKNWLKQYTNILVTSQYHGGRNKSSWECI